MSTPAALLRLLLSLALVLNGIGTVAASARMAGAMIDEAMSGHHATAAKPAGAAVCESHHTAAAAVDHHGHDGAPASPAKCGDHAKSDCCDSSACGCACAQTGTSALFALVPLPLVFLHGYAVPSLSIGHVAPTLALPIRPPIA